MWLLEGAKGLLTCGHLGGTKGFLRGFFQLDTASSAIPPIVRCELSIRNGWGWCGERLGSWSWCGKGWSGWGKVLDGFGVSWVMWERLVGLEWVLDGLRVG